MGIMERGCRRNVVGLEAQETRIRARGHWGEVGGSEAVAHDGRSHICLPIQITVFFALNHHVRRPWDQNSGRHWRGSNGYVHIFCQFLNLLTSNPGLGIAYVAALRAKVTVQLYDRSPEQISKGLNLMDRLLAKDISKGKIQEVDARHARERVTVIDQAVGVRALRDVDMVIEVRGQN
jgi:3-hydroxyacyl-CoA dehydrogenase, NAD binding domain